MTDHNIIPTYLFTCILPCQAKTNDIILVLERINAYVCIFHFLIPLLFALYIMFDLIKYIHLYIILTMNNTSLNNNEKVLSTSYIMN